MLNLKLTKLFRQGVVVMMVTYIREQINSLKVGINGHSTVIFLND